jgi:hypothetical protein
LHCCTVARVPYCAVALWHVACSVLRCCTVALLHVFRIALLHCCTVALLHVFRIALLRCGMFARLHRLTSDVAGGRAGGRALVLYR